MAKQIENATNEEFDFLVKKGWIDAEGQVTAAGRQAIFGGVLPPDGVEYRRSGGMGMPAQMPGPPIDTHGPACQNCACPNVRNGVCQQCGFGVAPEGGQP